MGKNTEQYSGSDEDESGGSSEGGKGGKGGFTGLAPDYNQLFAVSEEEAEIARCAKEGVLAQRISLKAQGEEVTALDRIQELKRKLSDPRVAAELANGGGFDFEAHPELAELGGGAFNDIVFPDSEAEAAALASNDPQLSNSLKMGLSLSAALELQNKKKLELSNTPEPPSPRPRYTSTPKPRPY